MFKRVIAISLMLLMLLSMLPQGVAFAAEPTAQSALALPQTAQAEALETDAFVLGAQPSDMITGGGLLAESDRGSLRIENGQLLLEDTVLAKGNFLLLNAIGDTVWYVEDDARLVRRSLESGQSDTLAQLNGRRARELYVVNGEAFYFLTDNGIERYDPAARTWTVELAAALQSFAPTPWGFVVAKGTLFHYDVYAGERLLLSDVDGWYVDPDLDGGSIVFTQAGETLQMPISGAFDGSAEPVPFTGYAVIPAEDLFTNLETPESEAAPEQSGSAARGVHTNGVNRKTLSQGIQNIVKRARQLTEIQWTPVADITGWAGGLTYKAGTTYTGLPYGQPVDAVYVPWQTDLTGFIAAVNDPNSKMYTDHASYNKIAPYYACDCSAFVSWAWNLSARQTTSSIANYATLVSSTTYTGLQVGDCFNLSGSHVVLVTDVTYDNNGVMNGVEISEATVVKATNYCCQKTWYGTGYSYPLSKLQTKYIDAGYKLYRSKTRDNATYTHVCVVPLEGDSCTICGYGCYDASPVAATVTTTAAATVYSAPTATATQSGTVAASTACNIVAWTEVENVLWYKLESGGWIRAANTSFTAYRSSVSITDKSFPTGGLEYGKSFPIVGNISTINPMTQITCSVYSGSTAAGTPVMTRTVSLSDTYAYTLKGSAIDNALAFGSLAKGNYTFLIEITEQASCSGQSSQSKVYRETSLFTVGETVGGKVVTAKGIDVSHHQGTINWNSVLQDANVDFVILRCGYGSSGVDRQWETNVAKCEELNIPYGVYLYSYASTVAEAQAEAAYVLTKLQGHTPTYPVYYDLEDSNTTGTASNATILAMAQAFCDAIANAGYTPGIYSGKYWWTNKLTAADYDQWSRWVAQYATACTYTGTYDMWQYTDSGSVSGITGNVDSNYWYASLPSAGHPHELTEIAAAAPTCTESGNVRYWYCALCGLCFDDAQGNAEIAADAVRIEPLGHNYTAEVMPATCLQYAGTQYTCARCGESYWAYDEADWSAWSTTEPVGVDAVFTQSRAEYRSRDHEYTEATTSTLNGWTYLSEGWERTGSGNVDYVESWPAGFSTTHSLYATYHNTPITGSETATNKTVEEGDEIIGYIYWHWCRGSLTTGPDDRQIRPYQVTGNSTASNNYPSFHAFFSATAPGQVHNVASQTAQGDYYEFSNASCCADTYRYYAIPVTRQNYANYQKIYNFERWTDWSAWGTEELTASDTCEVQNRTVYRYLDAELGEHRWDDGVISTAPSCTEKAQVTCTCAVCGSTRTTEATGDRTGWMSAAPSGYAAAQLETKNEYRYRVLAEITSNEAGLDGWTQTDSSWDETDSGTLDYVTSWPAGFDTSHSLYTTYHKTPYTASQSATDKTETTDNGIIGYIYWHWCRNDQSLNLGYRRDIKPSCTGAFTTFHAYFSTELPGTATVVDDGDWYNKPNSACCKDSYWYYALPVTEQTYAIYQMLFSYEQWGDWSDWSAESTQASDTVQVETRTLFRAPTAALGHDYEGVRTEPTCTEGSFVTYTCSRCGDSYTAAEGEWTATPPAGTDLSSLTSKTQYRTRSRSTTTSTDPALSGWTQTGGTWQQSGTGSVDYVEDWPDYFVTSNALYTTYHNSPVTASETETDKTEPGSSETIGYIYWHYCRGSYTGGPINRKTEDHPTSDCGAFHAFYSTTAPASLGSPASDNSYHYENGACCKDTYWYYVTPVTRQNYTTFEKLFSYEQWGDWSDWSDTAATASAALAVETRTVYRLPSAALGHDLTATAAAAAACTAAGNSAYWTCSRCGKHFSDSAASTEITLASTVIAALGHDWGEWTVTTPATATTAGEETRTCARCGTTETEAIPCAPTVTGYNLTTNGDVLVNSYIAVPQQMMNDDPGMYVTINNGDHILLSGLTETPDANGCALTADGFKFPQIVPAKNMQDTVTLKLYQSNGTQVALAGATDADGKSVTYSVQGYLDQVLADADAYETAYPGLVNLCKAMSAYGSYAQVQQNYTAATGAAHDPVTVDTATANEIAAISTASISGAETASTTEGSIDGLEFYGASLVMLSKMTLRFYFTYTGSGTLTCGGTPLTRKDDTNYYYVDVTGIAATDFGVGQTVTVSDGANTCTVSGYSVNRYVYKVLTTSGVAANMVTLAKAIANYGLKAIAYYTANNS